MVCKCSNACYLTLANIDKVLSLLTTTVPSVQLRSGMHRTYSGVSSQPYLHCQFRHRYRYVSCVAMPVSLTNSRVLPESAARGHRQWSLSAPMAGCSHDAFTFRLGEDIAKYLSGLLDILVGRASSRLVSSWVYIFSTCPPLHDVDAQQSPAIITTGALGRKPPTNTPAQ